MSVNTFVNKIVSHIQLQIYSQILFPKNVNTFTNLYINEFDFIYVMTCANFTKYQLLLVPTRQIISIL